MRCSSSNPVINASVLLCANDFLIGSETICTLLELLRKQLITVKCQTPVSMYQPVHYPLSLTTKSEYFLVLFLLVILIFFFFLLKTIYNIGSFCDTGHKPIQTGSQRMPGSKVDE